MTVVSYSELFTYMTCPRQHYYRYILGRAPLQVSHTVDRGIEGHDLLKEFYTGIQNGLSFDEAKERMDQYLLSKGERSVALYEAWLLICEYLKTLDLHGTVVKVEQRFVTPINHGLSLGFTPDLVFHHKDKRLDLEDYKFIAQQWPHNKLARFTQLHVYRGLLRRLGYDVRRARLRFFNWTTAKVTYRDYPLNEAQTQRILDELFRVAEHVRQMKEARYEALAIRTLNYNTCRWCVYVEPCTGELEGRDMSRTLENAFKTDPHYGYTE